MTERLYYTDAYLRDFEASVVERSDNSRRVYLDRTAFYPTSGGQPFDTGRLSGIEVTDVVDEGERIAHLLPAPLLADRTRGQVDWPRRFDHMQQHTGQHLLSAVLSELLGLDTVSVHFGKDSSTIDLDAGTLTQDQAARAEDRANQIVAENRPVGVSFEDAPAAGALRKPLAREGTLRVVTIQDLDRSACGGTHVKATGEIGAILVRKVERVRNGTRVEFLCGGRAIRQARRDYELLSRLAAEFTAAPQELPQLVVAQRGQLKEADSVRQELQQQLDLLRARELYAGAPSDETGIRRAILREQNGSLNHLRGVAQAYVSLPRAVFVGVVESPPAIMLAASRDSGVDAGRVLKGLLGANGGRGGGSAGMAQGMVPGSAELETVLASLGSKERGA